MTDRPELRMDNVTVEKSEEVGNASNHVDKKATSTNGDNHDDKEGSATSRGRLGQIVGHHRGGRAGATESPSTLRGRLTPQVQSPPTRDSTR